MPEQQIFSLLPESLMSACEYLSAQQKRELEELRLHIGGRITAVTNGGDYVIPAARGYILTSEDLQHVLERATCASIHTALPKLKHGFLPVAGGHRIGVCGTAVLEGDKPFNLRDVSSLNLRIARQIEGISQSILPSLLKGDELCNTLIISPPGHGKTTLLRDLIRAISEGEGAPPMRVGVADERGELCAMVGGVPQMAVGRRTDVMDGCPKAQALLMLLRGMNPEVLAVDEITAEKDLDAVEQAIGCGVAVLATAHAARFEDLLARPTYQKLLKQNCFTRIIVIERKHGMRHYQVMDGRGEPCCAFGASA